MEQVSEREFFYAAHGVVVRANRALECLTPFSERPQPGLDVWMGRLESLYLRHPELDWPGIESGIVFSGFGLMRYETPHDELLLCATGGAHYQVLILITEGGRAIEVGWRHDAEVPEAAVEQLVTVYLMSNLIGVALRWSGQIVLHGNAVRVGERAIAWVGTKGAGKSTLAAAFVDAGYPLLADDQVVIRPAAGGFCVMPGIRRLHLYPDSMPAFSESADAYRLDQPFGPAIKGFVAVAARDRAAETPAPLHLVYALSPRHAELSQPATEVPSPSKRLHLLLDHCLGRKQMPLSPAQQQAEFHAVGALARAVPVRRLRLPDDLARLPEVVRMLVRQ